MTAAHRTSAEANGPAISDWASSNAAISKAKQGSELLYDAMRLQFFHFALKHGVTTQDAMLFCMNAEEPR